MRGLTINYYLKTFVYFKCAITFQQQGVAYDSASWGFIYESSRKVGLLALF